MTTQEFSNAFDTLIASYNHKAEFGDLASYADVSLDEYEKSVFLTQALDNIIKTYFDNRANSIGEGFDDSIRRQADFSSLITVANPTPASSESSAATTWSTTRTEFNSTTNTLTGTGDTYAGFKLVISFGNESLEDSHKVPYLTINNGSAVIHMDLLNTQSPSAYFATLVADESGADPKQIAGLTFQNTSPSTANYLGIMASTDVITDEQTLELVSYPMGSTDAFDERGVLYNLPTNILLMLNERVKSTNGRFFTVVPISYKEYDREMSRAYSQPLKKQCWRLFEGESSDTTVSEIIPIEGTVISEYKIRYIRRPKPIILVELGFNASQEPLQIDGLVHVSECELNPILHMDILEEAVRLALNSKGIETRDLLAARQQAKSNS